MSQAKIAFDRSIKDAEELLKRFDNEKTTTSSESIEVLKRASLVMALASWETYVKDRIEEEIGIWLQAVAGSPVANFVLSRLNDDLKRFYNPNSSRTKRIFLDYFAVDVTLQWKWDNYDPQQAKETLDKLIKKRGSAAHQANTSLHSNASSDLIKRDELAKAIRFLNGLVTTTDRIKLAR